MVYARDVARAIMVLYVIGFFTNTDGKSIKKRVVTEVQLMHDWAEYLNKETRLEWLRKKLAEILPPGAIPLGSPKTSKALVAPAEVRLRKRADTSLIVNQDHQLAQGEKTRGKMDKADVDVLSKVNP